MAKASAARRLGVSFSDALVVAIAKGEKTVTRRLLDKKGEPRYRYLDELYVREAWRTRLARLTLHDDEGGSRLEAVAAVEYRADGEVLAWPDRIIGDHARVASRWATPEHGVVIDGFRASAWRPPRFMFRALARYWLFVVDTEVAPLQSISDEDIRAEGIHDRDAFAKTWGRLHKAPGTRWEDNPYVERVEFTLFADAERCVSCTEPLVGEDRDYCARCEEGA